MAAPMASTHQSLHRKGVLLLVLTTAIWGTSFPLLKQTLSTLSPAVILAVRFSIAAIAVAPWFRSLNTQLIRDGVLLGCLYFVAGATALVGLESTSANRAAFMVSLNVILVPLIGGLLGQRLSFKLLLATVLAISGIGIMSWEGGGLNQGDFLTIGCAVGIAIYILTLEAVAPRHPTLPLVAIQLLTMAVLSVIWSIPQLVEQIQAISNHLGIFLYLGLVVTATPVWIQAIAQRWCLLMKQPFSMRLSQCLQHFFHFGS